MPGTGIGLKNVHLTEEKKNMQKHFIFKKIRGIANTVLASDRSEKILVLVVLTWIFH